MVISEERFAKYARMRDQLIRNNLMVLTAAHRVHGGVCHENTPDTGGETAIPDLHRASGALHWKEKRSESCVNSSENE